MRVFMFLVALLLLPIVMAQEFVIRTSATKFSPRVEYTAPLRTLKALFGNEKLNGGFYWGLGSEVVEDGRPSGSAAFFIQTPPDILARGLRVDFGIEAVFMPRIEVGSGVDTTFNIAVQLVVNKSTAFAFSPRRDGGALYYARHY